MIMLSPCCGFYPREIFDADDNEIVVCGSCMSPIHERITP
jgi:hypothetical protein